MGKLQTKLGLAMILSKFSFELVNKNLNNNEFEVDPKMFVMTPKEKILMKARIR
jgi:hypothetical protein